MEQIYTLQSATESYVNKRIGEKIRRALTTERTEELRQLVQEHGEKKLSIEGILKKALEVSSNLLIPKNFLAEGTISGLRRIESLTLTFISSLGLPQNRAEKHVQELQELFQIQIDVRYKSSQLPVEDHSNSPGVSRKRTSSTDSTSRVSSNDKKMKADCEQLRRNGQLKANNDLIKFIFDNKLAPRFYTLEKLKILEIIIEFIKEKRSNGSQPKTVEDIFLFNKGASDGLSYGKALAKMFFTVDQNLYPHCAALEMYLDLHLNPQPLQGYPQLQQLPPVSSMSVVPVLLEIPQLQMPYPTPPPSASGSPPCLSPPVSFSTCFIPAIKENKSSMKIEEKKFFRPWE